MPTWVYRKDGKFLVSEKASASRTPDPSWWTLPWKQRMRKAAYTAECEKGSRFRIGNYSNAQVAKLWGD